VDKLSTMFEPQQDGRAKREAAVCSALHPRNEPLHPAWFALIRHCKSLGYGEIERLVIQDGIPVLAEVTRKKVKFT